MTAVDVALSQTEAATLADLEAVVDSGLANFVAVGSALADISASKLYRATHATFAEYAADRFGLGRSHAYRLIDAAKIAEAVSPMGDIRTERQARALQGLPPNIAQAAFAVAQGFARLTRDSGDPTADELTQARAHLTANPVAAVADLTPEAARHLTDAVVAAGDELAEATLAEVAERALPMTPEELAEMQVPPRPRGQSKPRQKPITDVATDLGFEMRKSADRLAALVGDTRYAKNMEQVALILRGHLLHVAETVTAVLGKLP